MQMQPARLPTVLLLGCPLPGAHSPTFVHPLAALPLQMGRMLDSVYRPLGLGAMLVLQVGAGSM